MNVKIYLDGEFSSDEHNELTRLSNDISIKWKMNIFPVEGDYFDLARFIGVDKLPSFANEGLWIIIDREFVDQKTIKLGLEYL